MKLPLIIINFKTYKESTGSNAVKLAKICEKVAKKSNKTIIIAVTNNDIYRVSKEVKIPVFSQHIDAVGYGANTGKVLAENVKENGASGVLINHSEDTIDLSKIEKVVKRARENNLIAVVCAPTPFMVEKISKFNPDFIAVEPPELIGGDVSVSKAKPGVITNSLKKAGKVILLTGAGVKTKEDVRTAIKLGSKGILLASGVAKAKNPEKILLDLIKGL